MALNRERFIDTQFLPALVSSPSVQTTSPSSPASNSMNPRQHHVPEQRMAEVLNAVKSVRHQEQAASTEPPLTAVKSTSSKIKPITHSSQDSHTTHSQQASDDQAVQVARTPNDALGFLRSQSSLGQVLATLSQLRHGRFAEVDFSLHEPGPLQAQLINSVLNTVLPDFWPVLRERQDDDLTGSLQNVSGFNAVITRVKLLVSHYGKDEKDWQAVKDLIEVVERLFRGPGVFASIWQGLQGGAIDNVRRDLAWKEFVSLMGSGKVIAVVAQAEDILNGGESRGKRSCWLSNGTEYAAWLGMNITNLATIGSNFDISPRDGATAASQVLIKALNLGYPNQLLKGLFEALGSKTHGSGIGSITALLDRLPSYSTRTFMEHLLRWLSSLTVSDSSAEESKEQHTRNEATAIAGLLCGLIAVEGITYHIKSFCIDPTLSSTISLSVKRACIAIISERDGEEALSTLLDKVVSTFSDQLFVNHAPILQQESVAQTILLIAGAMHRRNPLALLVIARSSTHMQGVSTRLDSTNTRARWLGMVVGVSISSLVDKQGSKMSFGTDDMQREDAWWYQGLVSVKDKIGSLDEFAAFMKMQNRPARRSKPSPYEAHMPELNGKPVFGPPRPPAQTTIVGERVTELSDEDDSDEDDQLKPYAKPDSDPEDSDEDATLVNRNKPRPPVYIRDLMSALRDDKNHDRFQLGLKNASALIRRKTNFGKEVSDHAEELARLLCNLQDPFSTEGFEEMKLQALIAVLLSDIKNIAPWLGGQSFAGDYSIAQRCIMLSALGLGGRELAGLKNEDELNLTPSNVNFPSKQLPSRLRSIYTTAPLSTKRLESATKDIEHTLIQPIALQAADKSTSHLNAVKVHTFSSRMDVERTKRKPAPSQLAKCFGEAFFFPLNNRYQQEIASYGSASVFSRVPFVLVTFLKTLALLLHASGAATLGLPQVSAEFWELLLSLRVQAVTDITVLQAVLFSLLTLLEVNTDKRRIAEEHPKQLMETQTWVDLVFERTGGGELISESGNEDEVKIRTLAAGVLVRTKEVIDAYQKQLYGYVAQ